MDRQDEARQGRRGSFGGGALLALAAVLGGCAPTASAQTADTAPPPVAGSIAQRIADMPRGIERKEGPGLEESMGAALAAVNLCKQRDALVSVLVVDSVGEPVVLLSGDGAGMRSQLITYTKAAIVMKWKMPSLEVAEMAENDPSITQQAASDPEIGMLRGGGFPIHRDGRMIGAVAVSGATLAKPGLDEACAMAAVDMLEGRTAQTGG